MHESSGASKLATGLCLFLDRKRSLFYQQCNVRDVENSKLIIHRLSTAMSISSSHFANCSGCQWSNDPFTFEIFLSPLPHLCWLWYVLMHELWSSVVPGTASVASLMVAVVIPRTLSRTDFPARQHNNEKPFKPFSNYITPPITRKTRPFHTHDLTKIHTWKVPITYTSCHFTTADSNTLKMWWPSHHLIHTRALPSHHHGYRRLQPVALEVQWSEKRRL